jgi:hypothetical protein
MAGVGMIRPTVTMAKDPSRPGRATRSLKSLAKVAAFIANPRERQGNLPAWMNRSY